MEDYAYQIYGAMYTQNQTLSGLKAIVWTTHNFYDVDIPLSVFDTPTADYLSFRLGLPSKLCLQNLPDKLQKDIRASVGEFLDCWVLKNGD